MKANIRLVLVAAASWLVAGCVSVTAHKAPNADLGRYRTFSFYEPPQPTARHQEFESSPAGQAIRNEVATELRDKGFIEVAPGQPADFLVAYHVKMQPRYQVTDWGYGPGWGWGWGWGWYGGPTTVDQYTEGTIIVDFVDPRTSTIFWRGTASSVVDHPNNPDPGKIAGAVDKLMHKYPTAAQAAAQRTTM